MTHSPRILYLSHGGGPMPLLGDPGHNGMVTTLQQIAKSIPRPAAIIVISAHWENAEVAITHAAAPPLIFDYYGFPDEAYNIAYPAVGEPALADELHWRLEKNDIRAVLDDTRGFDHGLFVPLKIMYPKADIPCIQLSLLKGLNPAEHIRIGSILASLSHKNLLIVGSGFSFHNMEAFFTPTQERSAMNEAFQSWLSTTCCDKKISEHERSERLIQWEHAPYARYCHPRAEHLLPLHVCYGAAGRACNARFDVQILGVKASMFLW
jgi:4,5-DOPA dioxygenase extradiol